MQPMDFSGELIPSGLYFYDLSVGNALIPEK